MTEEESIHTKFIPVEIPSGIKSSVDGPEVPKYVGPYKIESLLKKGGMSILYLASHPNTKEATTIKVLSARFLSYPEAVERFLNESEIIAITDHPNIVRLYGHGEWEGGLYIAMEFIQGISLRQAILQNPISLKRALEIIIDIGYALCHLHTHGVIHRDLKPENILITETGVVKVIDFGIAQLLTEKSESGHPLKQKLIGTPIYMSPEQREDPESVSYPSDIYSLGIIAYELILGRLSHGHIHLSLMPKGIQKILNKTLQPKPEDRYQDVVDFITDISEYLNSSSMQKEKKVGDQLSELSENLHLAQLMLTPAKLPDWSAVELGLASLKLMNIYGIYYDSFALPNGSYGFFIAESATRDAEGVLYIAVLRGMIRALEPLLDQPSALVAKLNALITQDRIDQVLALNFLLLSPSKNQLKYISCGKSNLWRIPALTDTPELIAVNNSALGVSVEAKFHEVTYPWEIGDTLILNSITTEINEKSTVAENSRNILSKIIQENARFPPQKIVDAIMRQITYIPVKPSRERAIILIGIRRKL